MLNSIFNHPKLNKYFDKQREKIVKNIPKSPVSNEYTECQGPLCSIGLYAMFSDAIYHLQLSPHPKKTLESISKCFGYKVFWHNENNDMWSEILVVYRWVTIKSKKRKHVIIIHRGTQLDGDRYIHDLSSYHSVFKNSLDDKLGSQRLKVTEDIIRKTKPFLLDITGHSLGGWSVIYSISKSKLIRNYLRFCVLFSPGYVPSEISNVQSKILQLSTNEKKDLDNKVFYYINSLDPVSKGVLKGSIPFGKVKIINKSGLVEIRKQVLFERFTMVIGMRDILEKLLYLKDFSRYFMNKILNYYGYNTNSSTLLYKFLTDNHTIKQYVPKYFYDKIEECKNN